MKEESLHSSNILGPPIKLWPMDIKQWHERRQCQPTFHHIQYQIVKEVWIALITQSRKKLGIFPAIALAFVF